LTLKIANLTRRVNAPPVHALSSSLSTDDLNVTKVLSPTRLSVSYITTNTKTTSSATAELACDAHDDEIEIQGHSRSSIIVPIDAGYMTSY